MLAENVYKKQRFTISSIKLHSSLERSMYTSKNTVQIYEEAFFFGQSFARGIDHHEPPQAAGAHEELRLLLAEFEPVFLEMWSSFGGQTRMAMETSAHVLDYDGASKSSC